VSRAHHRKGLPTKHRALPRNKTHLKIKFVVAVGLISAVMLPQEYAWLTGLSSNFIWLFAD
jgi:hypothetical protein